MHNIQLQKIYNFLSPSNAISKADLIIGFGHFDMRIVDHCAQLYENKVAPVIIFSGGVGAGSAGFSNPEAIEFRDYLHNKYPNIPLDSVIVEPNSTNTGENVRFTIEILKKEGLLNDLKRVILVATPTRQLRVFLTAKLYLDDVELINSPPNSNFKQDKNMNIGKGVDFKEHLIGELQRIRYYPVKGFCAPINIPSF